MSILETDYLVVGAGASGLAFSDTLLTESPEASITIVDDRPRPGGHWIDAYDFVRLHQPSAFYGVNSLPLGRDRVETDGLNAGYHELATGTEVCTYFDEVMRRVLLPSGRVRYFPSSRYDLERRTITSDGAVTPIRARTTVDATYVAGEIPARHTPSYTIASGVRHGPVNDLSRAEARAEGYVVIGAGKTGIDACLYLLERGTPPEAIVWIRPQDVWLYNRGHYQPGDAFLDELLESMAIQMEIAATASSASEMLLRLEAAHVLMRIDTSVVPTAYRCATVTPAELDEVRRIKNVVRMGRVRRLDRDRIVLERGEIPSGPGVFHVDCTAKAVAPKPVIPVFARDRITLQLVRMCQPALSVAFIAFVEARYDDEVRKNELCAVVPNPERDVDWLSMFLQGTINSFAWMREPAIVRWLAGARLNGVRELLRPSDQLAPSQSAARTRIQTATSGAVANLRRLLAPPAQPASRP